MNIYRILFLALILLGLGAAPALGQGSRLHIDNLDRFEKNAATSVDVTIDGPLLDLAAKALENDKSPDAQQAREIVSGLKGIYVRSYEFDNPNEYTPADVDSIRAQVKGPGWTRMVNVRSRREGENVEVYLLTEAGKVAGLGIIAFGPKELTVVNIVGTIDVNKLSKLDGNFGIPHIVLGKDDPNDPNDAAPAPKVLTRP